MVIEDDDGVRMSLAMGTRMAAKKQIQEERDFALIDLIQGETIA